MSKKTKQTRDVVNALDSSPKPTSKSSSKSPTKSNPKKNQDFCKDFSKDIILERINCALLPQAFTKIGTDKMGAKIMQKKGQIFTFLLQNLSLPALHILKQEALSAGGDLATPKEAILGDKKSYSATLIATCTQLEKLIYKCFQPMSSIQKK